MESVESNPNVEEEDELLESVEYELELEDDEMLRSLEDDDVDDELLDLAGPSPSVTDGNVSASGRFKTVMDSAGVTLTL